MSARESKKIGVLFVCLGNICRSPLAEGVFRHLVREAGLSERFEIASAGTGNWHVGDPPDHRSVHVARTFGVDISAQRGRHLQPADLLAREHVIVMDRQNLRTVQAMAARTPAGRAQVSLLLDEIPEGEVREVPDPYTGQAEHFEEVWHLVFKACQALLARLRPELEAGPRRP